MSGTGTKNSKKKWQKAKCLTNNLPPVSKATPIVKGTADNTSNNGNACDRPMTYSNKPTNTQLHPHKGIGCSRGLAGASLRRFQNSQHANATKTGPCE